jgi:hypothetical protein
MSATLLAPFAIDTQTTTTDDRGRLRPRLETAEQLAARPTRSARLQANQVKIRGRRRDDRRSHLTAKWPRAMRHGEHDNATH